MSPIIRVRLLCSSTPEMIAVQRQIVAELAGMTAGWPAPSEIIVSLQRERNQMRVCAMLLDRPGSSDIIRDVFRADIDIATAEVARVCARLIAIKFADFVG